MTEFHPAVDVKPKLSGAKALNFSGVWAMQYSMKFFEKLFVGQNGVK